MTASGKASCSSFPSAVAPPVSPRNFEFTCCNRPRQPLLSNYLKISRRAPPLPGGMVAGDRLARSRYMSCTCHARVVRGTALVFLTALLGGAPAAAADAPRIKALFLGDNGHHVPIRRAADLIPA